MLVAVDNREVMYIEMNDFSMQWLRVAAKSNCTDADELHPSPLAKRTRRARIDRIVIRSEHKALVKHLRYDRENIVAKYTNADSAEILVTLKYETWDESGVAKALTEWAITRASFHYVERDGELVLASTLNTPAAESPPV